MRGKNSALTEHGSSRSRSPFINLPQQETQSASVKDYGRDSESTSLASFSNIEKFSHSYFSVNETNEDETTSFYSALQDGFSVSDCHQTGLNENPNFQEFPWANTDFNERDMMLPPSNFQVFWHDLIYKIEPKITLGSIWYDFGQLFNSSLSYIHKSINCDRIDDYNVSGCSSCSKSLHKKEPITIIQQISGSFKSGELTAVMGPSGAGKTSLLNFLSRRREDGYTGQLYIDNSHRRIKISTIPQNDHLPEYLTVRENLVFASRLKNPQPNYDHEKYIAKVSNLLGLDDCLDTRTKKISGGQHKRLAIGQELLSRPDILILDEPTSGLDSLTCYKTLSVLKDLVKSSATKLIDPIAIVLTIHQPDQDVFELFDKIYVMANNGIAIYNGPPEKCTQFIEKHCGIRMQDKDYNPASFLIEIASGEYGAGPIKALEDQIKIEFATSKQPLSNKSQDTDKHKQGLTPRVSLCQNENQDVKINSNETRQKLFLNIDQRIAKGSSMNRGNFWMKTRILSKRYWISIIRDPKQMIGRILFHILLPIGLALIMGTEPGRSNACPRFAAQYELSDLMKDNNQTSSQVQEELLLTLENLGVLFLLTYSLTSANIAAITLSFTSDMQSSLKEYYNGWYSMSSYIIARFITDIPMEICLPIITLAIGYPLTGQMSGNDMSDVYRALLTALAIILGSMVGQTIGMIFGAIYIGHVTTALFASQGACLPLVFLSGFVVRTRNMSKVVAALSQLSFFRHALEITVIARYGYNACHCDPAAITGEEIRLVGVSDRLKSFTKFWLSSLAEQSPEETHGTSMLPLNNTVIDESRTNNSDDTDDIFQMFAKQISLYNTYGVDVKSCNDVKPYQLNDLTLTEKDVPSSILSLVVLLVITRLLLILTVKLVIHFRTSL